MDPELSHIQKRVKKKTVLAFGEGEDEKIFLRHLNGAYCRKRHITVQTEAAGGGGPQHILNKAIIARRGLTRDDEYILLDTDIPWPVEVISQAQEESIELIGNSPNLEALFHEILDPENTLDWRKLNSTRLKKQFEDHYCKGRNFDEDDCVRLFPKSLLNEARTRIPRLDRIIRSMEGPEEAV